jgi:hypothetical protein
VDDKNPHCTATAFCERVYWKGNSACGCADEFTRIELRPRWKSYPTLDFEMPRQRYELEKIERLMEIAYEQGKKDQMHLIRTTLKEIIGL